MPGDEMNPSQHSMESMVYKIFRNQQRQKWWGRIKLGITALAIIMVSAGIFIQSNRSFNRHVLSIAEGTPSKPHIALIDVKGIINDISEVSSQLSTSDSIIRSLRKAYKNPKLAAIILRINSPGGSGVQSAQIYEEIRYQKKRHAHIPIIAVCESTCASAAYYIASACDSIYANPSSIVGSIGVILPGIGFVDSLKKIGAERRLFTSGKNKALLDPLSPLKPEHVKIVETILLDMHQQFIDAVKAGRGDRLKDLEKNEATLFSGQFWTGRQALPLGLIDGFGSLHSVTRDILKLTNIVDYTLKPAPNFFLAGTVSSALNTINNQLPSGLSNALR